MTNAAVPVTFKCPPELLDRLPAPGRGRSKFIVNTLNKAFSQKQPVEWKPTTARGRKLAAMIEAGKAERGPDLTEAEFERELRERRGRNY